MPDMIRSLKVVKNFLVAKQYFYQKHVPQLRNGRFFLEYCEGRIGGEEPCPSCVLPELEVLFTQLEQGYQVDGSALLEGESDWTRLYTNAALSAGDFPEWENEDK